ncbi:hypothetical protein [Campylobacter canadensis]|uniref:hypothetical protein n=1 Tax=Campylobacter canadensis TaxID=449520 RepID=UPI001CCF544B|nr:hypothetical protein [Campylobacter canadensis]MBZ8002396.1 hypothetical protein [Campylobacter canadensis]
MIKQKINSFNDINKTIIIENDLLNEINFFLQENISKNLFFRDNYLISISLDKNDILLFENKKICDYHSATLCISSNNIYFIITTNNQNFLDYYIFISSELHKGIKFNLFNSCKNIKELKINLINENIFLDDKLQFINLNLTFNKNISKQIILFYDNCKEIYFDGKLKRYSIYFEIKNIYKHIFFEKEFSKIFFLKMIENRIIKFETKKLYIDDIIIFSKHSIQLILDNIIQIDKNHIKIKKTILKTN